MIKTGDQWPIGSSCLETAKTQITIQIIDSTSSKFTYKGPKNFQKFKLPHFLCMSKFKFCNRKYELKSFFWITKKLLAREWMNRARSVDFSFTPRPSIYWLCPSSFAPSTHPPSYLRRLTNRNGNLSPTEIHEHTATNCSPGGGTIRLPTELRKCFDKPRQTFFLSEHSVLGEASPFAGGRWIKAFSHLFFHTQFPIEELRLTYLDLAYFLMFRGSWKLLWVLNMV